MALKLAAIFGFVVFVVIVLLVIAVIGAVVRALLVVLRIVGGLCVAGVVGAAFSLALAAIGMDPEYVLVSGLVAAAVSGVAIFRSGAGVSSRMTDRVVAGGTLSEPIEVQPEAYTGTLEKRGDRHVAKAWEQLRTMLPSTEVRRLNGARDACARLLAASDADPLALELMELSVLIRRNIPELASRNAALWSDADEAERAALSVDILADMALLEKRAGSQLCIHRRSRQDQLSALRSHLAARVKD